MFLIRLALPFMALLFPALAAAATPLDPYIGHYEIITIVNAPERNPTRYFAIGDQVQFRLDRDVVTLEITSKTSNRILCTIEMSEHYEDMGEGRVSSSGFEKRDGGISWSGGTNQSGWSSRSVHVIPAGEGTLRLRLDPSSAAFDHEIYEVIIRKAK